ncbi:MAG TPA: hypothetical protein VHO90_00435 [Bacteroidales bacterium]|nr:hypothetical protein [Bacteroidales bacterium]
MGQILVKNIPENKLGFFMELVESLGFTPEVKTKDKKLTRKKQRFVDGLKDSLNEVEQHLQGKIKLKTADQLLNEL